jgi:superfamily II DNA or RNA helicase
MSSNNSQKGKSRQMRKSVFELFSSGAVEAIVAPRVLDEGVDVPEADFAVILAATKTRRQMIQRMGRILRPKADGRAARFAITYVRDTGEDPANGAHDAFFSEVIEVADQTVNFSASEDFDGLADFLNP